MSLIHLQSPLRTIGVSFVIAILASDATCSEAVRVPPPRLMTGRERGSDTRVRLSGASLEDSPPDAETWEIKHRETKNYINFLRQNEGRRPVSLRMTSNSQTTLMSSPFECGDNCTSANFTLPRNLRPQFVSNLITFLRLDQLLMVSNYLDTGSCIKIGRPLYKLNVPTTCRLLEDLYGYYPYVLLVANDQDSGEDISQLLMTVGERITADRLTISNLLVFLPSSTTVLLPPSYVLNYCVLQAKEADVEIGVEFKEVFTFGPSSTIPAEEVVGWWVPGRPEVSHIPYRGDLAVPKNFQGNVVRFVVIESSPYVSILNITKSGKLLVEGYAVDICLLVQKKLNFTIEWLQSPDGLFGIDQGNNSFSGVVGVLQRKEADVAPVPLNINVQRASVIDFSPPIDYAYTKLLTYRDGETKDIDWYTYITGFHWSVWLTLVGVWLVMATGQVLVAHHEVQVTLYNYLFTFIGALAQQGSSIEPECGRGRVVFFSFWIGSLIVYTSYTASLTSQLAVVYTVDPFSTLREALTTAGYSVGIQKGTSYFIAVQEMSKQDKGMAMFYEQLQNNPELQVQGNAEGLALIQSKGKYAYLQDTVSVNYDIKNNCSYRWLGPPYFPEYASLGYMKNLSYANVISSIITRATDSGITRKLMKKWMGERMPCVTSAFQMLGFSKTVSAFSLLAVGILLGFLLLVGEMWFFRWRKMRKNTLRDLQKRFPEVMAKKPGEEQAFSKKYYNPPRKIKH